MVYTDLQLKDLYY